MLKLDQAILESINGGHFFNKRHRKERQDRRQDRRESRHSRRDDRRDRRDRLRCEKACAERFPVLC